MSKVDRLDAGPDGVWSARPGLDAAFIGDARKPQNAVTVMNLKIKFRESFRPFAPSDSAKNGSSEYFEMPGRSEAEPLHAARRAGGG